MKPKKPVCVFNESITEGNSTYVEYLKKIYKGKELTKIKNRYIKIANNRPFKDY